MKKLTAPTLIGILLILALTVGVGAQGVRQNFEWVIAERLTVNGAASVGTDLTVGDDVTASGDIAGSTLAADSMALTGVGALETLRMTPSTAIMVTQGITITPAGSFQPLAAEGNVSTGAIAAGTAGDVLALTNDTNTTITISDTGTLKLSGNIALGQYDTLLLVSDGTNWVQVATTNN